MSVMEITTMPKVNEDKNMIIDMREVIRIKTNENDILKKQLTKLKIELAEMSLDNKRLNNLLRSIENAEHYRRAYIPITPEGTGSVTAIEGELRPEADDSEA